MTNLYDFVFKPKTITLESGHSVTKKAGRGPLITALLLGAVLLSIKITGFDLMILVKRGNQFWTILARIFRPDFHYTKYVWPPLISTLQMSVTGSFIGCVLALPYSVICSSNINTNKLLLNVCRLILSVLRTLPTLVLALIATLIFGLGTFAGTIAIGIFNFGMVSKMNYEYIETVDMGPYEAIEALGAGKARAFTTGVFPQVLPIYLSTCLYCVETTVRHAAVLGYVGAGGIGLILNEQLALRGYDRVGTILALLFVTVFLIESLSRYCRKKLS